MIDQARVEAFVAQVGVARGLISRAELEAAQSRSGGSLLARLNPQLTPESRSELQGLYHEALATEQAGARARGDAGRLRTLRQRFQADPGCLALIDAAR